MLLNAVKDVAMALGDLIHATKAASGKSLNDPAMTTLKESAKVSTACVYMCVGLDGWLGGMGWELCETWLWKQS